MKAYKKFLKGRSKKTALFFVMTIVNFLFWLGGVSFGGDILGEVPLNKINKIKVPYSIVPAHGKKSTSSKSAPSTGVVSTIIKLTESEENVLAAVESIKGYALKNKRLPDLSNFTSVVRNPYDSWGKPLVYIYDANLARDICNATSTSLTIRYCNDAACSSYIDIRNVAFIVLSGGANYNIQTAGSQSVSSSTIIKVYKQEVGPVDNYPNDVNRPEPYDDIVNYVLLDQLKTEVACCIPGVTSITLVNNSGRTWSTSKGTFYPGQSMTISPNENFNLEGRYISPYSVDANKNCRIQISGVQQSCTWTCVQYTTRCEAMFLANACNYYSSGETFCYNYYVIRLEDGECTTSAISNMLASLPTRIELFNGYQIINYSLYSAYSSPYFCASAEYICTNIPVITDL
jgi:hypothetical protein